VNQQWNFTGIEFQVMCDKYRGGSMPDPLDYTLDEPMTIDESARLKEKVWEELQARWDPTWDALVDVMCAPEMYIRIHGWDEMDQENGDKNLYLHFARSGAQAFSFVQRPGKSFWHTNGFTVTEIDPRGMANAVVNSLPEVPAGRLPNTPMILDPAEHIGHGGSSFFKDDDDDEPAAQVSAKFWQMRAALTGSVWVVQGRSKYGPRGIRETKMMFRDIIGDGRYLMTMDDSPVAVGTSATEFVRRIQKDIDNLMDRLETHWEAGYPEDRY
jgi:hypothetical protein